MPQVQKSVGHVAFVGEFEFYRLSDGDLYWARTKAPIEADGRRAGRYHTPADRVEFALSMARLAAGEISLAFEAGV